jgi:hypothetical protein
MKHTILFLAANPLGTDRLALDREARAIQIELERSGFRDRFELETRWAVEPLDLLRELRKLKPTVVHFSGHGSRGIAGARGSAAGPHRDVVEPGAVDGGPDHGLWFQGPDGQPQRVSTAALQDTFDAAGSSVKLVVLSACYSEPHAAALLGRVDCVVGMRRGASRSASTAASGTASRSPSPTSKAAPRSACRGCPTQISPSSRSAPASTRGGSSWHRPRPRRTPAGEGLTDPRRRPRGPRRRG